MKTFGERLREERKKKYRFAGQFAEVLGMEPPRYRRYERGEVEPDIELLVRVCDLLDISVSHLIPTRVDSEILAKLAALSGEAPKGGSEPKAAA